ncbi:hypothetical protein FisN_38Lu031 [Fistulifera solaris]|uniref:Uncharacterized protein n=1 Tax=Fistulifera solaris TaxID=1519565 RepID=A0A1Z5J6G2_FISSO|nr:hypothetical protein FisN_38Lu031 [Fistulifera solaris]|eukprot:GAX09583.1 hypothetical protein FisN_38Lu031 [Fistulifera solaris]
MFLRSSFFIAAVWTLRSVQGLSFSTKRSSSTKNDLLVHSSRRTFLQIAPCLLFPHLTNAAIKNNQTVFREGESLTIEEAKARFQEGRTSMNNLLENYDAIAANGGDNVRRYLGTVGTTSGLYGIQKVLRTLQDEANDIVEYTESLSDFEYYLSAADTAAYSAIFVEYSAAKTKPEEFFADAKKAVQRMRACMDQMAQELAL